MAFIFVPNADGSFTEGDKQTNPDTGVEYIYNSGAWRALGAKIEDEFDTLDERYATNEYVDDGDQSVKDYVDDAVAAIPGADLSSYIKNEGTNNLPANTNWKILQGNNTLIQGKDNELGLYNLKEPSESHHAATKGYVDAKPSGGGGISASRPPGLKFNLSIPNLPDGYFQWWVNSSTNNQHLELATTDKDGIAWGTNTLREDVRYDDEIPFTIWEVSNNAWKMKVHGTISRIDFHPDHALCYVSSNTALNVGAFVNGSGPYYITISGLF